MILSVKAGSRFLRAVDGALGLPQALFRGLLRRATESSVGDGLDNPLLHDFEPQSQDSCGSSISSPPRKRARVMSEASHNKIDEILQAPAVVPQETNRIQCDADGLPRVILHKDGERECPVMTLTEDMVLAIATTGKQSRALEQRERLFRDADIDLMEFESSMFLYRVQLDKAKNEEEIFRAQLKLDEQGPKLQNVRVRKDFRRRELEAAQSQEKATRRQLQRMLEQILEEADLLNLSSLEPETIQNEVISNTASYRSANSEVSALSAQELLRRHAQEKLAEELCALQTAQEDFDDRHNLYEREVANYQEMVLEDQFDLSQSCFDVLFIEEIRRRTRTLIAAEERYETARAHVRALGLPDYSSDVPYLVDRPDDGYRESQEARAIARVDRPWIKYWSDNVCEAVLDQGDSDEVIELDDWDAQTVGMADSASVIDEDYYGPRIRSWQQTCRQIREQRDVGC